MASSRNSGKIKLALINGPNLNMLGLRETDIYGGRGLDEIETHLKRKAKKLGAELVCFQSNHEGKIIDFIHDLRGDTNGIIANLGAYTHTSIAIRDAFKAIDQKVWEVHISNVYKREKFRQISYISDIAEAVITGLGVHGYDAALEHAITILKPED